MLTNTPTGVAWSTIPALKATTQEQLAEQTNICWRATGMVDTFCDQVLRATVDNEQLTGPGGPRVGVQQGSCNGELIMRRWPVTQALAVQTSPNATFPRVWSAVPSGKFEVGHPLINMYTDSASATMPEGAQSILVAPGYITWRLGRNGYRILVSYVNGWPHASLTAAAAAAATTLQVDDVTGFTGASAFVYDGAETEPVAVTSVSATSPLSLPNGVGVAQTGPGTLTLAAPLANPHQAGVVVSALPPNVIWGTVYFAVAQALTRGATATAVQSISSSSAGGAPSNTDDYNKLAQGMLQSFRRVI